MFKIAKYYFLLNWFQKIKKNIIAILVFFVLLVVLTYMFGDLIAMSDDKLGLVIAKWIAIIVLLAVIAFNVGQIFKSVPMPFKREEKGQIVDSKKEEIVTKKHLISRSDLIINKYRDNV